MLLLPPAMVLLVVGTSNVDASLLETSALVPIVAGLLLLAAFARHALRVAAPLLRVRLLGQRLTGGGALVLVLFVGAYFSTLLLVPLYFQVARGESATTTGLLMMPQAVAAGISIQVSGRLIDRVPPIRVIGTGIALATFGYAAFAAQLADGAAYGWLVAALVLGTTGAGACMLPTMTLATRYLEDPDIPSGSTIITVLNQLAASLVTAAVSVVLAAGLTARLPELDGGVGDLQHLARCRTPGGRTSSLAESVRVATLLPVRHDGDHVRGGGGGAPASQQRVTRRCVVHARASTGAVGRRRSVNRVRAAPPSPLATRVLGCRITPNSARCWPTPSRRSAGPSGPARCRWPRRSRRR